MLAHRFPFGLGSRGLGFLRLVQATLVHQFFEQLDACAYVGDRLAGCIPLSLEQLDPHALAEQLLVQHVDLRAGRAATKL